MMKNKERLGISSLNPLDLQGCRAAEKAGWIVGLDLPLLGNESISPTVWHTFESMIFRSCPKLIGMSLASPGKTPVRPPFACRTTAGGGEKKR